MTDTAKGADTTGDRGAPHVKPLAETALEKLNLICNEIYDRWEGDMRSGKLLSALAGRLPATYRAECTDIRRALAAHEDLLAALQSFVGMFRTEKGTIGDEIMRDARAAIAKATGDRSALQHPEAKP